MSKRLLLVFWLLLATAASQVHKFGALDTNNTWTATDTFTGTFDASTSLFSRPFRYVTLATIPGSCSANRDTIAVLDAPQGQKMRICNATGTGFEVAGGVSTGITGQFVVDGVSYTTIQSAITAASTTGSVLIPSSYAGSDVYTNPNKIQILDLRGKPNRQRGYINMLTDCGLKGDGVTDDGPAIQACLDAYPGGGFIFPQTVSNNCSYFSNQTLYPKGSGVQILGGSGSQYLDNITPDHMGGTEICFGAGVTGIWLDIDNPRNAYGGAIRNISLRGKGGISGLQTPTGINLPSTLPQYTRSISSIQRAANVLTVTVTLAGGEGLTQQVGSTVKITGVVGDATLNGNCVVSALSGFSSFGGNPITFTCPQNGANTGPFVSDGKIVLPSTGTSTADGIRVCSNFWTIDHVGVLLFERHGINADSQVGHGCSLPFSDDLIIHDSMSMDNGANGFYGQGDDFNAGIMSGNSFYNNFLWAIEDQSALQNTWVGNNLSNNGHLWATTAQPAAKAINTISRTLTSGVSQVSVVLSVADANLKLGSCVVIAGVTDASFNTATVNPNACFFINSFTDSTHFGYEQPGAPANASSSGGTSRMATFREVFLASGADDGAQKIQTQAGFSPLILNNYVEGGQGCKFGTNTIMINGANTPPCSGGGDWTGQFITTQGCNGLGGHLCLSAPTFFQNKEFTGETQLRAGIATDQQYWFSWLNHSNSRTWILIGDPAGTLGGSGSWEVQSGTGETRLKFFGKDTNSGNTYVNAEGAGGKVIFGKNYAGSNAGTGGIEVDSGGASPVAVGGIDGAGIVTGSAFKSTTTNPASAGLVRLAKTDTFNFRNNANSGDVAGLSLDASDRVVVGGTAGIVTTSIPVPGTIGGTTPGAATFTTLTINTSATGPAFISNTANPSSAGALRLAKTDAVNFRNNANGADITALSLNGSDQVVLPTLAATSSAVSFTSPAYISSTTNPAAAGVVRLAKTDALNFRNNAASGDINGVSLDGSDVVQVGGNTNGVRIGSSGAALKKVLTTTSVIDFAIQAANTCTDSTGITLTGAVDGDSIDVGAPAADWVANVEYSAYVSASDTVKVRLCNNATGASADPASGTFRVTVRQY